MVEDIIKRKLKEQQANKTQEDVNKAQSKYSQSNIAQVLSLAGNGHTITDEMQIINNAKNNAEPKEVRAYCHFSVKKPKGKNYGIFSCVLYSDKYALEIAGYKVQAQELWSDNQYITYCQAYEYALRCISHWQGKLIANNVKRVMLVTNNSVLLGWIENPYKNKKYTQYILKASQQYAVGGSQELQIPVGLMQPQPEQAHKYCKEEYVDNKADLYKFKGTLNNKAVYRLQMSESDFQPLTLDDKE